ncbi:MAG TPA: Rieske 2Fe-2S domain-containing protein [Acidimicrobiia bacterium]|jgi:nitrite reductase/ring-hydroxylating ferredoxin subunit
MAELAADGVRTIDRADAIRNGTVVPYYLHDRKVRVSIARVDDHLYAFSDLCTCADESCPLSGGLLTGVTVMCQCHGSQFDITTGVAVVGPATEALTVYEVREVDGTIQVRA